MERTPSVPRMSITNDQRYSLRRLNATMAVVHGLQAALMIALSNSRSLPVTGVFANGPPGQPDRPLTVDQVRVSGLNPPFRS